MNRNKQINIRLTEDEYNIIVGKAAEYGLDISTYLRLILKLGKLPKPQNTP